MSGVAGTPRISRLVQARLRRTGHARVGIVDSARLAVHISLDACIQRGTGQSVTDPLWKIVSGILEHNLVRRFRCRSELGLRLARRSGDVGQSLGKIENL